MNDETLDNSMEWLLEELRLLKAGANIDTDVDIKQAHNSIRSHLLADVMRVLESKRDNRMFPGMGGTDHSEIRETCYQQGTNETLDKLEQAFNELLGGGNK